jgi:putative protease
MSLLHRLCPDAVIHVSTQTSIISSYAALEYVKNYNAKRLVLARELSLSEIIEIRKNVPEQIELEAFVHGAMCVSYSGRCLLSNHFTGRDGNSGMCAQPCRWNYKLYSLSEERDETRTPGIMQTEEGTFILSSRDMCMIEHIKELCEAGISSFKIEGRMKSVYYAAATAYAYRHALDLYFEGKDPDPSDRALLESVTHREYDTGYYFDSPSEDAKTVTKPGYIAERPYYGIVISYDGASQTAKIKQKNKLFKGETVSFLTPHGVTAPFAANEMRNEDGIELDSAPHPKQVFSLKTPYPVGEGDLLLP